MILPRHQEQLFYSTLRIEVENPATGKSEKGTGFIVKHALPANPELYA
jgi:hypothetical protein